MVKTCSNVAYFVPVTLTTIVLFSVLNEIIYMFNLYKGRTKRHQIWFFKILDLNMYFYWATGAMLVNFSYCLLWGLKVRMGSLIFTE